MFPFIAKNKQIIIERKISFFWAGNDTFSVHNLIFNIFCSFSVIKKLQTKKLSNVELFTKSEYGHPVEFPLYVNINFIVEGRVITHFVALGEHSKS